MIYNSQYKEFRFTKTDKSFFEITGGIKYTMLIQIPTHNAFNMLRK